MPSPVSFVEILDANNNVKTVNVTTDPVEGSDITSLKDAIENQDTKLDELSTRIQDLTEALQEQSGYSDMRSINASGTPFIARAGFPDKFQGFEVFSSGTVKIQTEEASGRIVPVVPGRIYPVTIVAFRSGGTITQMIAYQE